MRHSTLLAVLDQHDLEEQAGIVPPPGGLGSARTGFGIILLAGVRIEAAPPFDHDSTGGAMTAADPSSCKAPSHLTAASRRWFEAVAVAYDFEPQHIRLLQAAAESWDLKESARRIVADEGLVVRDRFGQRRAHPAVQIERDARLAFARLIRELMLDDADAPEARPPRNR